MLIPDLNLLIYAHDPSSLHHSAARLWWEELLNSKRSVGLAWVTILGFIRLSTNHKVVPNPTTPAQAVAQIRSWMDRPNVRILTPGEGHAEILFKLLEIVGVAGNLTTDAHLAALAIEYHAELASSDTDFARFPGLRWQNPLRQAAR